MVMLAGTGLNVIVIYRFSLSNIFTVADQWSKLWKKGSVSSPAFLASLRILDYTGVQMETKMLLIPKSCYKTRDSTSICRSLCLCIYVLSLRNNFNLKKKQLKFLRLLKTRKGGLSLW